ncbi:MAG TPA: hypothetical protein VF278_14240 [Pirellulales bacterium]
MSDSLSSRPAEVDQLLLNARLRDELEPFFDESIARLNVQDMPTSVENEYLASMLAWERAPVVPISQWFDPELAIAHPDRLSDAALGEALWQAIHKLFEKRIVLDFTDHLSDRQLYCLIYRDILPSPEKKLESPQRYLHWDCADAGGEPETWLRFYASEEEREHWAASGEPLPPSDPPPYPRQLPRQPPE